MDRCDECGFVYDELPERQIGPALRALLPQYGTILGSDPVRLRAHPIAGVWSPLEYACHVRDVFQVQYDRVELALTQTEPSFEPMYREQRVVNDRYNEQDPTVVEQELIVAARALADQYDALTSEQLSRTAVYNFPTPGPRTVAWIGRHTVHEGHHHLRDIEHVLEVLDGADD